MPNITLDTVHSNTDLFHVLKSDVISKLRQQRFKKRKAEGAQEKIALKIRMIDVPGHQKFHGREHFKQ